MIAEDLLPALFASSVEANKSDPILTIWTTIWDVSMYRFGIQCLAASIQDCEHCVLSGHIPNQETIAGALQQSLMLLLLLPKATQLGVIYFCPNQPCHHQVASVSLFAPQLGILQHMRPHSISQCISSNDI